jgi:L-lactate dehydrogenase complex protein LldG
MNARDRILQAVRGHLGRTMRAAVPPPPPVPLLGRIDLDAGEKLKQFGERLAAVGGHLHLGLQDGGLAVVRELLAQYTPTTIARSDARAVAALREHDTLRRLGWLSPAATKEELFAADLGITAAQWAIAETGTLVLDMQEERHRLASLLPPVHIALLPHARLLANLGEALKTLPRPLPPTVTFVTGPSRTADIELQLVVGVHGPRELHVVLI